MRQDQIQNRLRACGIDCDALLAERLEALKAELGKWAGKKEERERAKIEKLQQREMEKRLKKQKKIQKLKKKSSIVPGVVLLLFFGISALVAFFVVKYLI